MWLLFKFKFAWQSFFEQLVKTQGFNTKKKKKNYEDNLGAKI